MKYQFGVTIGSTLDCQNIGNGKKFDHVCVLDLRRCVNNGPLAVEESLLRKLANYRVAYEQMPMSLYSCDARVESDLFRIMTEQTGNMLVLTDEPAAVARFCQQLDVPFTSTELAMVETSADHIPVQIRHADRPSLLAS